MSSKDYWAKREAEALKRRITDEKEYDREIKRIYANMLDACQKEVDAFYGKYAAKEGITIAEAKKRVSKADIAEYERKAKRYVREKDFSAKANEEMRLYNTMMKVNRMEMLKANIGRELIAGYDELEKFMAGILKGRTEDELERQAGILGKTVLQNARKAEAIVNASFHNATFSDRIWMYQDLLRDELDKALQSGLIQGKNPRLLARDIKKQFSASTFHAERLMRTELARVQTEAQKQSFERNGFTEYEFIVNSGCCDICQGLSGKHFPVAKMMPGNNAPPMHPHCRCSTAAWVDSDDYEAWLDFLDKGGTTAEWGKQKKNNLTNTGKSGNIGLERLDRKKSPKDIEPMPKKQLQKIVKGFKRNGGVIQMNAETDAYLKKKKVEGITLNATTILLKQHSGRAAVFEELIHTAQYKNGRFDGTPKSRLICEIEAAEKLLKWQRVYKLTAAEVELTKENLAGYKAELEQLLKGGE